MKNEDLNPETQEKLLQLQKYQEQQLRDPMPLTPLAVTRKRLFENDLLAESEPPTKVSIDNSGYVNVLLLNIM